MSIHLSRPGHEPPGTGRPRRLSRRFVLLAAAASLAAPAGSHAQSCPPSSGAIDNAKPNKLYLYFPASGAAWFPAYTTQASPAEAFDVSLLKAYTGTLNSLRDAIHAVVVDDYCEFNVQVLQTTTRPPATFARRATVAIGTDSRPSTFGQADAVDVGNARAVDFARVWAGTYQANAGGPNGVLNGTERSTLERWATSIGGTAAHEAGHLYGLSHLNGSVVRPGEDARTRHLMPAGALLTDEQRAGYRRHFNDTEFSILAANVGLSIQTMHNWGLINPNQKPASRLRIDFLSTRSPVALSGSYTGPRSPWTAPTVTGLLPDARVLSGYHRFRITWSAPNPAWTGTPGQVPPGGQFFVGASFAGVDLNAPDPIIITDITLFDASNTALPLAPRLPGYDAGTLDAADGSFDVGFFGLDAGAEALVLADVQVFQLPRVLSIDAMLPGAPMRSWTGEPVLSWPVRDSARPLGGSTRIPEPRGRFALGGGLRVPVARLGQGRHIFENVVTPNCSAPADRSSGSEVNECVNGIFVDLFPATTVYLVATVVDPQARHWDPAQGRFVVGPLQSHILYQFAGHRPDLNRNGTDDAIDLFRGTSEDADRNGVPDDARPETGWFRWWWLLLLLLVLAAVVAAVRWRSRRHP
jgi:hypothetical protein